MSTVNWIDWDDERPDEEGMYLTHWDDGTIETYPLDDKELKSEYAPEINGAELTHWALLPEPPQ